MHASSGRCLASKHHRAGTRPFFAARTLSIIRQVKCHGVVPVGERNGWWLKRPQPNLLDASGLEDLVRRAGLATHPDSFHRG